MKILTQWLRAYLPALPADDTQLAEDLTLRGIAVEGVFPLENGHFVFDMDITTNRVDAMNHYGIAREAAAIYNLPLHSLDTALPTSAPAAPFPLRIEAAAESLCGRFTAQVIRNVNIAPSQGTIAAYFTALGQKQISNAVDISNFVLLGMGHPNHVFDLDKIEGGIVVRRALSGEQIKLLDGSTRILVPDDLVIADDRKALSLAGVMGGFDSSITPETRNILIEAAWFSPAAIRATSRRHLIHTDASHRYERGADFAAPPIASALVAKHLLAACGGTLTGPLLDLVIPQHAAQTAARPPIQLALAEVHRLLGATVAPEGITSTLVEQFLRALGCTLTSTVPDTWQVTLPSWRLDLTREIDLIEEIARVYGYNRFRNTLPTPAEVIPHPSARAEQAVRARLFALGFSEAISSTFASASESAFFAPSIPAVALENPLSEDAANLRPSLLPGMVTMLAHNLNRDVLTARLFESGAIFTGSPVRVDESLSLSLGLTGDVPPAPPVQLAADAPFFDLKGALASLIALFATPELSIAPAAPALYEPGRAATFSLACTPIAHFGQLSLAEQTRRKLRQPLFLAELNLAELLQYPLRQPLASELSRFQAVDRDFSFIFPDAILWSQIESTIRALEIPELQRIVPIEIWRDSKKHPGVFASLTRTTFQSQTRTLTDEDLTSWWAAIIAALQALGGTLRDS